MMNDDPDSELREPVPCVIRDSLLQKGARDGLTQDELHRLEDAEAHGQTTNTLSPPEVKVLRMCYMNIRKIDNLQAYSNLKELYLSNNLITKIENLSCLPNLLKLDLSFNKIDSFDGLESLVNLEELSLFKNNISQLSKFPNLPKLRFLSLGRNKIDDLTEISALYKLKSLRILTLIDNPIHDKDIYKLSILAYLPSLHFLDYTRVTKAEILDAKERNTDRLNQLQQQDDVERMHKQNEKDLETHAKLLRDAFLNKVADPTKGADLQTSLFKKDNDHAKLRTINEIAEPFMRFVDDMKKATDAFTSDIIMQYRLLNEEEQLYSQAYNIITEENRLAMVKIVKELERKRRYVMESLIASEEEQADEPNEESLHFIEEIDATKDELFTSEFALEDQVAEMIHMYETELDDRYNVINDKIIQYFGNVRTLEIDYNEKVTDICMKLWERFNQGEAVEVTDEIRAILVDKDTLLTTITQSHDHRTTKLYKRQEDISNMYKTKIEMMTSTAKQNDLERNRKRIAEISNYISLITSYMTKLDGADDEND